jgi:sugar transferase (PEP-CTERM/EpsH1 system associated)
MKLFVIASRIPYPLEKGDKLRIYHQVKELSKNNEVLLCCLHIKAVSPEAKKELQKICKQVEFVQLSRWKIPFNLFFTFFTSKPFQVSYFYQKTAQRKIDRLIQSFRPDYIYAQLIRTSEYVKHFYTISKTLDYMDSFSKGMERRAENSSFFPKLIFDSEAKRLLRYENLIFDYFDKHSIISEQDRDQIWHEDRKQIHIIPNGLDANYFYPRPTEKKYDLLFSGNMSYIPNVDAAVYLAKEIFPLVKKEIPDCTLLIAGVNPHAKIEALRSHDIIVSGWMDDIRDAYWSSRVFVAPLRLGSGLQNKLLEAMATKIPSVTSPLANNALGAQNREEILIASNPQEFANEIIFLLRNEAKAKELSEKAYAFVCSNFNWERSTHLLENVIREQTKA